VFDEAEVKSKQSSPRAGMAQQNFIDVEGKMGRDEEGAGLSPRSPS
jgi:hypothetical protein